VRYISMPRSRTESHMGLLAVRFHLSIAKMLLRLISLNNPAAGP